MEKIDKEFESMKKELLNKKQKKFSLIPKLCSRCGNDLMTGRAIFHLPFEKRYIAFCGVCFKGLEFPSGFYAPKSNTDEEWNKFWEEEIG